MKLAFIVNDIHPLFETITLSQIKKVIGTKPILIVGIEKALEYDSSVNLSNTVINEKERVSYIFSRDESDDYQQQLDSFITILFKSLIQPYKITDISKNPGKLAIDGSFCFLYETPNFITITTASTIYYLNKEVYSFFSQDVMTYEKLVNLIQTTELRILSWNHPSFFPAYLKTLNQYIPLESVKAMFKTYGDVNLYLGVICIKWFNNLKTQITDFNELTLWQRAYLIETQLSSLKIKINAKKLKNIDEDNTLLESIYNAIQDDYVIQKYNGTDNTTGRMFARDSDFSIQTLPTKFRDIVIPEKGCILLEFDYDYFEYFLLSQICKFPLNGDPHINMSQLVWGDDEHRVQSKAINYAVIYGQSLTKTVDQLDVPNKDKILEKLAIVLEPIESFKQELQLEYQKNGFIKNYYGRSIFPKKDWALLNNYIQSTAADYVIIKLEKLFELLKDYSLLNRIVLQNHDSILLNLELQTIEDTNIAEDIQELLEEPEEGIYGTASLKYGYDWKNIE